MAKKFTRGITNIKNILKQDFDTNNVNDLLSDGEHNYIHRKKKDKTEEYHNLTNNLKTIKSDNTDLLTVTNNNNTTNSATLHPKHDAQKEQVIESTRNTIDIYHGKNGTSERSRVDTNPEKVLEHDNLLAGQHLTKEHVGGTNTTTFKVADEFVETVNNKQDKLTFNSFDKSVNVTTHDNNVNIEIDYRVRTHKVYEDAQGNTIKWFEIINRTTPSSLAIPMFLVVHLEPDGMISMSLSELDIIAGKNNVVIHTDLLIGNATTITRDSLFNIINSSENNVTALIPVSELD